MRIEEALLTFKEQFKIISKIQKILLNMNEENYESLTSSLNDFPIFEDKHTFCHFLESIDSAIYARPKKFRIYVNLILLFKEKIKLYLNQDELFHIFGSHIVNFHLFINSFYTTDFILSICKNDEVVSMIFKPFFEFIKSDNETESYKFKENCLKGENPNKIAHTLRNDDVVTLQYLLSHSNLDINMKISRSIFEISYILYEEPTLIEYAAFFQSFECFKYLFMQENIKITPQLSKFAVAGGNYSIIHLLENRKIKFTADDLNTAVQFHQNEVAEYLRESFEIDDKNNESLFTSITYYNIRYFTKHINEVLNINIKNKFNSTLLHTAAFYGQYDLTLFLLNIDGIDLDAKADFNRTPIQVAEEMGENEIVYLIKSFKENSKKRK